MQAISFSHCYQNMENNPCIRAGVKWVPRRLLVVLDCHSKYIRKMGFSSLQNFGSPHFLVEGLLTLCRSPQAYLQPCGSQILTISPKIQTAVEISWFCQFLELIEGCIETESISERREMLLCWTMTAILIAALGLQGCLCLGAKPVYKVSVFSIHCTLKMMCGMPQTDLTGIVPSQAMPSNIHQCLFLPCSRADPSVPSRESLKIPTF